MKKLIKLTSTNPSEYPDLVVECRVIKNSEISEYIDNIPEERKFTAYKSTPIKARIGKLGEKIVTIIKTIVDGREYVLTEETGTVKEEEIKTSLGVEKRKGFVVKNINSTSDEEYVVKASTFARTYELDKETMSYIPIYDSREFAQVDENIMFETAWGSWVICLKGSYIVTYDAAANDYNAVEKDAFRKTYTKEESKKLIKMKK